MSSPALATRLGGTIVITGSNGGMTALTCKRLAQQRPDAHLVLLMRKPSSLKEGVLPPPSDRITYKAFDMAILDSVRKACSEITSAVKSGALPEIEAVVCSAAIQVTSPDQPRITKDGYEETVAVNHLAHFVQILELLPHMQPDGRVVIVGSDTHRGDFKYFKVKAKYRPLEELLKVTAGSESPAVAVDNGRGRYATSKLLQTMIGHELARRVFNHPKYASLQVVLLDPGSMGTGLYRDRPWLERKIFDTILGYPSVCNYLDPGLHVSLPSTSANMLYELIVDPAYAGAKPLGPDFVGGGGNQKGASYWRYNGLQQETFGEANEVDKCGELWRDSCRVMGYEGARGLL